MTARGHHTAARTYTAMHRIPLGCGASGTEPGDVSLCCMLLTAQLCASADVGGSAGLCVV